MCRESCSTDILSTRRETKCILSFGAGCTFPTDYILQFFIKISQTDLPNLVTKRPVWAIISQIGWQILTFPYDNLNFQHAGCPLRRFTMRAWETQADVNISLKRSI